VQKRAIFGFFCHFLTLKAALSGQNVQLMLVFAQFWLDFASSAVCFVDPSRRESTRRTAFFSRTFLVSGFQNHVFLNAAVSFRQLILFSPVFPWSAGRCSGNSMS
jgi:hypothetical protein